MHENKNDGMKYLTLDYIRAHSRIDCDCENEMLETYGSSAEDVVLNLLNRSLEDLKEAYGGEVPTAVVHATLELVENFIQHRSPVEQMNLSVVPYNFDIMLKPYIVL